MKSNNISKYLYSILKNDVKINEKIGENIFPIIAEYGSDNIPYITYVRNGSKVEYSKDGIMSEIVSIEIEIVHTDYDQSNDVALIVRNILDNYSVFPDIKFNLINNYETWEEGRFIQTLIYDVFVGI